jgi:hypothetical protein
MKKQLTLDEIILHLFGPDRMEEDEDYQYELYREQQQENYENQRLAYEEHLGDR